MTGATVGVFWHGHAPVTPVTEIERKSVRFPLWLISRTVTVGVPVKL